MTGALIITVGIPGSGKSFCAQQELAAGDIDLIVSTDDLREELVGDASSQEGNTAVFVVMHARVSKALEDGKRVLVDATNLRPEYRQNLRTLADAYDVPAWAYLFADSHDFDLCQSRNLGRERVVPEYVMHKMSADFQNHCSLAALTLEGWYVEIHATRQV